MDTKKKKELQRDSFIKGTTIAYLSIVFTKILGAVYSIPFKAIIGDEGGVIYNAAYSIYSLFLNLSTSGIPTAMSIIISEYIALDMLKSKEAVYRLGQKVLFLISFVSFLILMIFAKPLGTFLILNAEGGVSPDDVALSIRIVALCLLVVPFLSVKKGYLQGHKFISVSSYSQVIEQIVRVAVILIGSYVAVRILKLGVSIGVATALFGAFLGAVIALIYLNVITYKNKEALLLPRRRSSEKAESSRTMLLKIAKYCIPIVIVSISNNIYEITDLKLVLVGLNTVGYEPAVTETISSIIGTWGPKICMIITSLAIGLSTSLVPNIVDSYVEKDYKEVNRKFNRSLNTVLLITVPFAVAMILLSKETYAVFYGKSDYGPQILQILAVVSVLSSLTMVSNMALQSIGRARLVIISTIIGLLINAGLDLPLIFLFQKLGLPAYLGPSVSSIFGQGISLIIILITLKKDLRFRYRAVWKLCLRIMIPTAAMGVIVFLIHMVLPAYNSYITLLLSMALYAFCGGLVYLILILRSGAFTKVFGNEFVLKAANKIKRG